MLQNKNVCFPSNLKNNIKIRLVTEKPQGIQILSVISQGLEYFIYIYMYIYMYIYLYVYI